MTTLSLNKVIVDPPDRHMLEDHHWGIYPDDDFGVRTSAVVVDDLGRHWGIELDRLIVGLDIQDKRKVDHLNGDGYDCRRENLEIVTWQEFNRRIRQRKRHGVVTPPKTSKYRGVSWDRGNASWRASIMVNGKQEYLGLWYSEEGAAEAYDERAREIGRTRLNFPDR